MATLAKEVIGDRVPLIVGTVAIRLEDSIRMAEHAAKIGAASILVGSPPYSVPTERENALNALAIDRAADLPIMLYNYPGRMGINMGEAFLARRDDIVGGDPHLIHRESLLETGPQTQDLEAT